jgi:hypothetical protein
VTRIPAAPRPRSLGRADTPADIAAMLTAAALRALGPRPTPLRALDPAVGGGVFLRELARRLGDGPPGWTAEGLDRDPAAVAETLAGLAADGADPGAVTVRAADFLSLPADRDGTYHLIVGNPPFVRVHRWDADTRAALRGGGFRTVRGDSDLYVAFFERAVRLLAPGGVLGFVSSDKFVSREYGRPLRELLLSQCEPLLLADIRRLGRMFSADVYPLVSLWRRRSEPGNTGDVATAECRSAGDLAAALAEVAPSFPGPQRGQGAGRRLLSPSDWISGRRGLPVLRGCRRLGDLPGLQLYCGTPRAVHYAAWGRFLRDGSDPAGADELPLLTCGQVTPYRLHRDRRVRAFGRTVTAPRLARPAGHVSDGLWERFGRSPKLLLRANDVRITAAVAEAPAALVGLYGLTADADPHALAALLNSPVCTVWLWRSAGALRVAGGYYSLTAAVFADLPVPEVPPDLSAALAEHARLRAAEVRADDAPAADLFAEAYGLSRREYDELAAEPA